MATIASYAGDWLFRSSQVLVTAPAPTLVVSADPRRWMLAFQPTNVGIYLLPKLINPSPNPLGFTVKSPNDMLEFGYLKWGAIVGYDWYAHVGLGSVVVNIFEVIRV